jgi:hypothetical protein
MLRENRRPTAARGSCSRGELLLLSWFKPSNNDEKLGSRNWPSPDMKVRGKKDISVASRAEPVRYRIVPTVFDLLTHHSSLRIMAVPNLMSQSVDENGAKKHPD